MSELANSNRKLGNFKGFNDRIGLVVPDVDLANVERNQHPRLGRMQVNTLDAVGARGQLPLDVETERLK